MDLADLSATLPATILDAALRRAARMGWDATHLHDVADDVGVSLAELARHYPDKHSLGQALFDRADRALLACASQPGWRARPAVERLETSLFAWFEALAPHRAQVREMMAYQLQPEHPHLQVEGILRISSTVQWWREASCLPAIGARREALEFVLTSMYLSTVVRWLSDSSIGSAATRRWLAWQLGLTQRLGRGFVEA